MGPKSRGYQATKANQVLFQNGGRDSFNRANSVFLSRSVDISTTKMSYNVNSPAFYELKEDIYTIIVVKEQSTTIGSVANAVLQVQPQLTSDRLGTRLFTA